jgi:hypothetical protein
MGSRKLGNVSWRSLGKDGECFVCLLDGLRVRRSMWKQSNGRKKRDEELGIKVMMRARTSLQLLLDTCLSLEVSRDKFDPSTDLSAGNFSIGRSESIERRSKTLQQTMRMMEEWGIHMCAIFTGNGSELIL